MEENERPAMKLTITEDQFERLSSALNVALSLSLLHASGAVYGRMAMISQELDDAWNDQNHGSAHPVETTEE